jgi:hypothetical protein
MISITGGPISAASVMETATTPRRAREPPGSVTLRTPAAGDSMRPLVERTLASKRRGLWG